MVEGKYGEGRSVGKRGSGIEGCKNGKGMCVGWRREMWWGVREEVSEEVSKDIEGGGRGVGEEADHVVFFFFKQKTAYEIA